MLELSKQEKKLKIEFLQQNINWIEKNVGDDKSGLFVALKSSKKEIINNWALWLEELLILGEEIKIGDDPLEIHQIATYIKKKMREKGLDESVALYVNDVLPFKYKNNTYNPYKDSDLSSVKPNLDSSDFKKQNASYIKRIEQTIELLYLLKSKLRKAEFLSKIGDEKQLQEFFARWDTMLQRGNETFDYRQTVLTVTQPHLVFCIAKLGIEEGISQYLNDIKEMSKLTAKQANKIAQGKMETVDILLEPKNKLEAKMTGFYGIPCPDCGSWRVLNDWNVDAFKLRCYSCGNPVPTKTDKLLVK